METRIISLANEKGGVGRTTTAANLGGALAAKGRRVLLLDLDPQAHLSRGTFGLDVRSVARSAHEVLTGAEPLSTAVMQFPRLQLDLIPATGRLRMTESDLVREMDGVFRLKQAMRNEPDFMAQYDFVFIDCPTLLGFLTANALVASTHVMIPLQTQYLAMEGVPEVFEYIERFRKSENLNPGLEYCGILATQYDARRKLDKDVWELVKSRYPAHFETRIRMDVRLAEAPASHTHIFGFAPDGPGAADYTSLGEELLEKVC